ncbi:CBS domain-containing protein [Cerasibacillus terrae]|uniref:CBS domain-containing protein n=1 Tax=Cerasibacillus terrae TaxID=2498845 RepID=UPI001E5ED98B|nr:CBS domain-containing protein [Cerasibacillus terrae]
MFVVNRQRKIQGIVTIDDAINGVKQKQSLENIICHDYMKVDKEEYINDLIPKAIESRYPLAVVDQDEKLLGIILRVHVLAGLVSEDIE